MRTDNIEKIGIHLEAERFDFCSRKVKIKRIYTSFPAREATA